MMVKYLSETNIRKLLQCSRCKVVPSSPPVYMCRTGHHECSVCFARFSVVQVVEETEAFTDSESDSASTRKGEHPTGAILPKDPKYRTTSHSCAVCKEEVLRTRNLLAENLIFQLENGRSDKTYYPGAKPGASDPGCIECCFNIYGHPCTRVHPPNVAVAAYESQTLSRYEVPCGMQNYAYQVDPYLVNEPGAQLDCVDPSVYYPESDNDVFYYRRENVDRRRSSHVPQSSVVSLVGEPSKRPIRCPTHLCGRNIAVTALSSHFTFDHPDVPPVKVDFDVSSHLFIVPDAIPFNYGRCIAILLIPNKYEAVSSVSQSTLVSSAKGKNAFPLVVMASKLDCVVSPQPAASGECEESDKAVALNHGDHKDQENVKAPLVVIWLAGVETNSSILTTLQVADKQTIVRSVVYTGPVTSLRSCQNTTNVFEQGDCLVVHSGMLENIVGDSGGFDLQVVVH